MKRKKLMQFFNKEMEIFFLKKDIMSLNKILKEKTSKIHFLKYESI